MASMESTSSRETAASHLKLSIRSEKVVKQFILKLKRRRLNGSHECARATLLLLRSVVEQERFENIQQLLDKVRFVGRQLVKARPIELSIGNIVRRVLEIIRHEHTAAQGGEPAPVAELSRMYYELAVRESFEQPAAPGIIHDIMEALSELLDEIDTVQSSIAEMAVEHIHADEVILTFGESITVLEFLKQAAQFRKFEVIVAEAAPTFTGQKMAKKLAAAGIDCTVISDSAVFAMMARVNTVLIGSHSVLANGGLVAQAGTHPLCVAAKHHSVPVMVLFGLFKLTPQYAFDQGTLNEHSAPSEVLDYGNEIISKAFVSSPSFDYVPPEYVDLLITNLGGHNPAYIYRLLSEYYNPEDATL
eukprot:235697_1